MELNLFNNLSKNKKENDSVQSFIKELSNYLDKITNNLINKNDNHVEINYLKQENCLYQVVEMSKDGVYLQNTTNNCVSKENDISKEILDKIGNDSILRYKDGKYIYEEELTRKIL